MMRRVEFLLFVGARLNFVRGHNNTTSGSIPDGCTVLYAATSFSTLILDLIW